MDLLSISQTRTLLTTSILLLTLTSHSNRAVCGKRMTRELCVCCCSELWTFIHLSKQKWTGRHNTQCHFFLSFIEQREREREKDINSGRKEIRGKGYNPNSQPQPHTQLQSLKWLLSIFFNNNNVSNDNENSVKGVMMNLQRIITQICSSPQLYRAL